MLKKIQLMKIIFIIILAITIFIATQFTIKIGWQAASNTLGSSSKTASNRPAPPNTGTPTGNSTPLITKPELICKKTKNPLTGIFANKGSDFTSLEYPTFWFYVPYASKDMYDLEFTIYDDQEENAIFSASVNAISMAGIIKIKTPSDQKYSLKPNQDYIWRLKLYCGSNKGDGSDQEVNGWVRRLINQGNENKLSYDAIDKIAIQNFDENDPKAKEKWRKLLMDTERRELIEEKFVKSQLIPVKN